MQTTLAFLLLLLPAYRVVVLGDSNSCGWPTGCPANHYYWPGRIAPRGDWTVVNRALPGMAAGKWVGYELDNGDPPNADWHLDRILREDLADSCVLPARPKLVIAVGTNDLPTSATPLAIASAVASLRQHAMRANPCIDVYVATLPPTFTVPALRIVQVNAALTFLVPADRLIPFHTMPASELALGGLHITDAGHTRRGRLATATLFPDCAATDPPATPAADGSEAPPPPH